MKGVRGARPDREAAVLSVGRALLCHRARKGNGLGRGLGPGEPPLSTATIPTGARHTSELSVKVSPPHMLLARQRPGPFKHSLGVLPVLPFPTSFPDFFPNLVSGKSALSAILSPRPPRGNISRWFAFRGGSCTLTLRKESVPQCS